MLNITGETRKKMAKQNRSAFKMKEKGENNRKNRINSNRRYKISRRRRGREKEQEDKNYEVKGNETKEERNNRK